MLVVECNKEGCGTGRAPFYKQPVHPPAQKKAWAVSPRFCACASGREGWGVAEGKGAPVVAGG